MGATSAAPITMILRGLRAFCAHILRCNSFVLAGLGCAFAALCSDEFAAMIPVAGSAYTYAYATLGELLAWIIGWDLILEYGMASRTVAYGWSKYFLHFVELFGLHVPPHLASDPFSTPGAWFNLPAGAIVLLVTIVLVVGIQESATFNATMVVVKLAVVAGMTWADRGWALAAFWALLALSSLASHAPKRWRHASPWPWH